MIPQHNSYNDERQRTTDALTSEALRKLRAGKQPAELRNRYGSNCVDRALERLATEAPTRPQVYVAQQRRTREANKQFGKELHQAGVEVRQHTEADFVFVIMTALGMFEECDKVSVDAGLARSFPNDPGKAKSIGDSRNHKRFRKAMLSDRVRGHPALAHALAAGTREYKRCARGLLFRDALGFLLGHARLHKRITALEESRAEDARRILELEARVALLEAAVAQTKAREELDDTEVTTTKEKVMHLFSSGYSRRQIADHLGIQYDTVKKIVQRDQQKQ